MQYVNLRQTERPWIRIYAVGLRETLRPCYELPELMEELLRRLDKIEAAARPNY
jgi:hypothetical protein